MSRRMKVLNADGTTSVYLDAFPSNHKLQLRPLDERDIALGEKEEETP